MRLVDQTRNSLLAVRAVPKWVMEMLPWTLAALVDVCSIELPQFAVHHGS